MAISNICNVSWHTSNGHCMVKLCCHNSFIFTRALLLFLFLLFPQDCVTEKNVKKKKNFLLKHYHPHYDGNCHWTTLPNVRSETSGAFYLKMTWIVEYIFSNPLSYNLIIIILWNNKNNNRKWLNYIHNLKFLSKFSRNDCSLCMSNCFFFSCYF